MRYAHLAAEVQREATQEIEKPARVAQKSEVIEFSPNQ